MRLDRLPVGEAIVGFLLVALVAAFLVARSEVSSDETAGVDGGSPTASTEPTAPGEVEITMTDNKFDNAELSLSAGEVTIPLTNNGVAVHNVHIAAPDGSFTDAFCSASGSDPCSDPARLAAGATGTLTFTVAGAAGDEIPYRCDFHPTEMKGTITVQ
jgi:plastocyanin